jgi:large subunit ribosomal protein L22
MESTATLRFARISAQKARLVADLVRGKDAGQAIEVLSFLPKKMAPILRTLVESAMANAEHAAQRDNRELDIDRLFVKTVTVDQGPALRRFRPRAQGRATPILKKTAHITVVLGER